MTEKKSSTWSSENVAAGSKRRRGLERKALERRRLGKT